MNLSLCGIEGCVSSSTPLESFKVWHSNLQKYVSLEQSAYGILLCKQELEVMSKQQSVLMMVLKGH